MASRKSSTKKSTGDYLVLLKSFGSEESAKRWLSKNYIEGAFIERGSVIKSIDHDNISGSYNIVIGYNDLTKILSEMKPVYKAPMRDMIDRFGRQGSAAEGWVAPFGAPEDRAGRALPASGSDRSASNLLNLFRERAGRNQGASNAARTEGRGAGIGSSGLASGLATGFGASGGGAGASRSGTGSSPGAGPGYGNAFETLGREMRGGDPVVGVPGRRPGVKADPLKRFGDDIDESGLMDRTDRSSYAKTFDPPTSSAKTPEKDKSNKKRRWAALLPFLAALGIAYAPGEPNYKYPDPNTPVETTRRPPELGPPYTQEPKQEPKVEVIPIPPYTPATPPKKYKPPTYTTTKPVPIPDDPTSGPTKSITARKIMILKSFSSYNDADYWIKSLDIKNAKIEQTSGLKSVGHQGGIPKGKYHVIKY
jgi:cell division septation protein DedD